MSAAQLSGQDVAGMTPDQVAAAVADGRLNAYLGRPVSTVPAEGQLTAEHLQGMSPDEIAAAFAQGRCDDLLGRTA